MATRAAVAKAVRLVAETYYGEDGIWLCRSFDAINQRLFDGGLPQPLITIEMTRWGKCPGWSKISDDKPPHITIHPCLFGDGGESAKLPWGFKQAWLGKRLVFDVLIHECVHLAMRYQLGDHEGPTSHNNDVWIDEVNRLCPLIGLRDVEAGRQVPKRIKLKGQSATVVKKVDLGNVPFNATAAFPYGIRMHQKTADHYYRRGRLPFQMQ